MSTAARRPSAISVLVVDDHRTFAEALALALEGDTGFDVRVATSWRVYGPPARAASSNARSTSVARMAWRLPGASSSSRMARAYGSFPE